MTHASFQVRCSCGAVAGIHWDQDADRYRCDNPAWCYHADEDDESPRDRSRLWHCGEEGHYQAGLREVPICPHCSDTGFLPPASPDPCLAATCDCPAGQEREREAYEYAERLLGEDR